MSVATQTDTPIKLSPFDRQHRALSAKLVPFAGYSMPIQYHGMTEEHLAVRRNVGLFDLSHMGEFEVTGSGALEFLQRLTCNDVAALNVGQAQYNALLTPGGGFVDDLLVYRLVDRYLLVVNASNIEKDFNWLSSHNKDGVTLRNLSDEFGLLAIQGPNAQTLMARLTDFPLANLKYYEQTYLSLCGEPTLVARTGYTGEDGFEIYLPLKQCADAWDAIAGAGETCDLSYIGLGARDTLRLEMRMALYGNDIDDTTTPLEAGLAWIVKFDKGDFIGKDALVRQKADGLTRKLVCLTFAERCVPRHGYPVSDDAGNTIGQVTSGAFSPSLQIPIALAYVPTAFSRTGATVQILIRGKSFTATVVKPPFYSGASHR